MLSFVDDDEKVEIEIIPRRCGLPVPKFIDRRAAALAAVQARIQSELVAQGELPKQSTRGSGGTPVVCLDVLGPDGKPRWFGTATVAAQWAGLGRGYFIYKAIVRAGKAGNLRWAWADPNRTASPDEVERVRETRRKHGNYCRPDPRQARLRRFRAELAAIQAEKSQIIREIMAMCEGGGAFSDPPAEPRSITPSHSADTGATPVPQPRWNPQDDGQCKTLNQN